ncbi:sensor histidine kinase [Aeromicrobium sp. CF4.19]|uniref:sensor histidine kinase n=1 Tax=Aeromicrobium sp. CF4.19 TaxID=3373082 RepID=UPI003EE5CA9F
MRWRPTVRISVRQRLTAAVGLLSAAALLVVGATLYVIESRGVEQRVEDAIAQEVDELRRLHAEGVDPETGVPFASPDRLVTFFLSRNLPERDEMLWAFPQTGQPSFVGEADPVLARSTAFPRLVRELAETGGLRDLRIAGERYRVAVQPVTQGAASASFVVTSDLTAARAPLRELMVTYSILAALSVLVIAAIASWLAGRLLAPVTRLRDTAHGITEGDLSGRLEVTGNDDLTDLQRTFNAMLDRLEEAFASQRRLLDDAAHELRTPLTVLRGHLELLDPHDVQDVQSTRALLTDEIDRMARLVSDLLLLAKVERPDFVRPETHDVEALTLGVLERARALSGRAWVLDGVVRGSHVLDGQRITQALLQLAENAVRHTDVGDEIGIGSRWHDGSLELWVRDAGTGVPDELRERVFERFTQDEQAREGFGLGLSIVTAIAEAHHGHVMLDPATPGAPGATFRLVLPGEGPA